jgi:microcystin-dependent protein
VEQINRRLGDKMASPPFNINQALPGDSDIVSQHPTNARAFRDIVESWLLINHNNLGQHTFVDLVVAAAPASPAAGALRVYANADGNVAIAASDGTFRYAGLPPGAVIWTASATTPVGFLIPDGSAVSRSTFSALFTEIGTQHGAGNGTTTFNLPDIKGRVIAGEDAASSRLSTTYLGATPTLAAVGGSQSNSVILTHTHIADAVANHQHLTVFDDTSGTTLTALNYLVRLLNTASDFSYSLGGSAGNANVGLTSAAGGHTPTIQNAGTAAAHSIVQPTIILRALIKT